MRDSLPRVIMSDPRKHLIEQTWPFLEMFCLDVRSQQVLALVGGCTASVQSLLVSCNRGVSWRDPKFRSSIVKLVHGNNVRHEALTLLSNEV